MAGLPLTLQKPYSSQMLCGGPCDSVLLLYVVGRCAGGTATCNCTCVVRVTVCCSLEAICSQCALYNYSKHKLIRFFSFTVPSQDQNNFDLGFTGNHNVYGDYKGAICNQKLLDNSDNCGC